MTDVSLRRGALIGWVLSLACLTGCELGGKKPATEPPPRSHPAEAPLLAGTIGSATYLANIEPQPVRGFGVVVGLGENGSRDCPTVIRDYLIEAMTKEMETWGNLNLRKRFSPSELLDSPTTAVVEISGLVPAGARPGARFDLDVQAIPGTSTRSIAGGLLLPCELRLADPMASYEMLLGGPVVARAGGPVFVNPFAADGTTSEKIESRRGVVLGGGQNIDERSSRLLLREPSYPTARRIERRINERFGQRPQTAEALSRGYLNLHTPEEYAYRAPDFLQLVTRLYLDDRPVFVEEKLRELSRMIVLPDADCEGISLAWEGIGKTAIPRLQALYSHADPRVRFYAARAGLRLKDVEALPIVAESALSAQPALALLAIRELGRCSYPQAAVRLAPLLDSSSEEIRVAAYEALLSHRHQAIRSRPLPSALDPLQINLVLDVVESSGKPLIYVRRTRTPRIAIFTGGLRVNMPIFYTSADDSVTLNAGNDGGDITLFTKHAGHAAKPLTVPPRVVDLVEALGEPPVKDEEPGQVKGAGLPYSQVVQILAALCRDGSIPAHLEIERTSVTEMFGPERTPERPETDAPGAADQVASRREGDSGNSH